MLLLVRVGLQRLFLLPDKSKASYRTFFENINSACDSHGLVFNPAKIRMDYEHLSDPGTLPQISVQWLLLPLQPVYLEVSAEIWTPGPIQ